MYQFSSQWSNGQCKTDFSIKPSVYYVIQLPINLNTKGVNYMPPLVFRYEIIAIDLGIWLFQKKRRSNCNGWELNSPFVR